MAELGDIPEPVAAPKARWSWIWLVPIVAVLIGLSLAVKAYLDQGPTITISFKTGEGLEQGKTKLRFRDVEVGLVTSVKVSEQGVIATAELAKGTEKGLVEDTRFWVVRPRIAGGNVTGLGTLLSGAYIGVDVGKSSKPARHFVALEKPPVFTTDLPGRQFLLRTDSVGSLDTGAPVFFRRVQVGQVASYELNPDGKGVTLTIFVNAPYDRYVTANTRFWHASGIDVALDASGLRVNTQGLVSILVGGIAFAAPPGSQQDTSPAENNAVFDLAVDRVQAMRPPDRVVDTYRLVFRQSTRGLSIGAPVDFRGIVFGEVAAIYADLDPKTLDARMLVEINVFPERMAARRLGAPKPEGQRNEVMIQRLVDKGLRAQLRTGNLVTGQLYVALDFFPNTRKVKLDFSQSPVEIPTVPGSLEDLQQTITLIAKKLDRLPLEAIGANLNRTLEDVNQLVKRFDTEVMPEARDALAEGRKTLADASRALSSVERSAAPDGPLAQELQDSVREIGRAARTMRLLADYLERHPEALIVGKQENGK